VAFDFGSIAQSLSIASITEPDKLFDALPNKAVGYGYLRAVQKEILVAWHERRNERDLVIKTNTGGGKTIAGLLILQASLHEGVAPALYVAPDPHVAAQVLQEAANLGLAAVDDPSRPEFLSGQAICVTTMQKMVNGRSRFGLAGSTARQPVKVGTIVVDDAHAALALTEDQTYVSIPRANPLHEKLVDLFGDVLAEQGQNALLDIEEGDRNAVLRVPFWTWSERQSNVLALLRPERTGPDLEWTWPLVHDLLPFSQAVVTADAFEIVPPCPPIEKIPSFAEAERRVYLTATLADDSILVTHFNANPKSVADSIYPSSAADLGDRLVLAPQELNPAIFDSDVRNLAADIATRHNVVVLAPSWRKAREWSNADRTVSTASDISAAVDDLRAGHVGLVVIVARYDGIDLPEDACRLLIIDGLPYAYRGFERREAVALRDSDAMVTRQLQRLEQGMGRGVRSREDRCAVLLMDPRLTQLVARADVADRLSPATRAQLALSRQVANDLGRADLDTLRGVIEQVINGDPKFREVSRAALVGVAYEPARLSPEATHLRQAYDAATTGRFSQAAVHADEAVKAASGRGDLKLAGWLGETLATYLQFVDAVRAQGALSTAIQLCSVVLRPIAGVEYKKISAAAAQAAEAARFLASRYGTGAAMLLGFEAVLNDLVWDNDKTDETEAALADLADHLGIVSQRPERDYGIGSDVLWLLGRSKYAVIEAKSGATGDYIWKKDINQLAGSVNWAKTEYGPDATVVPVVMHHSNLVERSGTPPADARVLMPQNLDDLKDSVREMARGLAQNDGYRESAVVAAQLQHFHLQAGDFFNRFSVAARRSRD
jgi:hypothetical protein